jgi:hypothetical protein
MSHQSRTDSPLYDECIKDIDRWASLSAEQRYQEFCDEVFRQENRELELDPGSEEDDPPDGEDDSLDPEDDREVDFRDRVIEVTTAYRAISDALKQSPRPGYLVDRNGTPIPPTRLIKRVLPEIDYGRAVEIYRLFFDRYYLSRDKAGVCYSTRLVDRVGCEVAR